jgi:PAS domain S-box-containing protein
LGLGFWYQRGLFSPRWKSLLGFEDHELDNHFDTFRALTHPDDYPRIMDAVQRHMETKEPYAEEFRMRTKDGAYIWISTRGHCTYNAMGQPVRMSGSHRDITDLKEAELARLRSEARLLESESKFKQLAENIREVFWILSADRQEFFYVSPAFEEFWGASCQAVYQDASIFFDAIVREDRLRINKILDAGAINQSGLELEFRIHKSDLGRDPGTCNLDSDATQGAEEPANLRWMWAKIFPITDEDGNLARLCGIAHDITGKKEVEKHVNEFYSTISHELRTPLTAIRAALGLVEGGLTGDISSETLEYTSIARDNCDRLIRLISDMLDLKKVEANHLEFRLSRLKAIPMIQITIDSLKPYAEQCGVSLKLAPDCLSLECIGDSDRVIQILTNLLSNAIRYTPSGKSVLVTVSEGTGGWVRFSVQDQGPGIVESEKQDLFGPFQQLSCIENEVNRGTGLGLAISKVLVEKLGGTIGVNSQLGEGAEFWFELPACTDDHYLDKIQPPAQTEVAGHKTGAAVSGLKQPLVLILEDSDSIALILKSFLFKKGFSAVRSATIADAKDLLKTISPDLVIADVHLPDGNGITFVNWLQDPDRSKHTEVPVIVLSGVEATPESLRNPSMVDWVRKPFESDKLLSLIKERLDISNRAQTNR